MIYNKVGGASQELSFLKIAKIYITEFIVNKELYTNR